MTADKIGRGLMIAACLVVVATLVAAMSMLGSPSTQRDMKFDEKRTHDLDRIVQAVSDYTETNQSLPPTLDTLARQPGRRLSIVDPDRGVPYTYQITSDRTFRLCAVFATDTGETPENAGPWIEDEWLHDAGRQCFDRKPKAKSEND